MNYLSIKIKYKNVLGEIFNLLDLYNYESRGNKKSLCIFLK